MSTGVGLVFFLGAIGLIAIGIAGIVLSNHLFRMVLALAIAEAGANLLLILAGYRWDAVAPILEDRPDCTTELVKALAAVHRGVCVVGDPDHRHRPSVHPGPVPGPEQLQGRGGAIHLDRDIDLVGVAGGVLERVAVFVGAAGTDDLGFAEAEWSLGVIPGIQSVNRSRAGYLPVRMLARVGEQAGQAA